jgi:hypothetical protein
VKKDLEELETLWELYNTACEEQIQGSETNSVMSDFIEKRVIKLTIHDVPMHKMTHFGFSCFIAGLEMGKRKQNKPDGGKKKETEKCGK